MRSQRMLLVLTSITLACGFLFLRGCRDNTDQGPPALTLPAATTPANSAPATPEETVLTVYHRYWTLRSKILTQENRDLAPLQAIAFPQVLTLLDEIFAHEKRFNVHLSQRFLVDPVILELNDTQARLLDCVRLESTEYPVGGGEIRGNQYTYLVTTTEMRKVPADLETATINAASMESGGTATAKPRNTRKSVWKLATMSFSPQASGENTGVACLPIHAKEEIFAVYEKYWETLAADPQEPWHLDIPKVTIGHARDDLVAQLLIRRDQDQVYRGTLHKEPRILQFDGTGVRGDGNGAKIWDCIQLEGESGIFDTHSNKRLDTPARGSRYRVLAQLRVSNGAWKIAVLKTEPDPNCLVPEFDLNKIPPDAPPWMPPPHSSQTPKVTHPAT